MKENSSSSIRRNNTSVKTLKITILKKGSFTLFSLKYSYAKKEGTIKDRNKDIPQ